MEVECENEREEENYKERKETKTVVRATSVKKRVLVTRMISLQVPKLSPTNSCTRYRCTCRTQTLSANKFMFLCSRVTFMLRVPKTRL